MTDLGLLLAAALIAGWLYWKGHRRGKQLGSRLGYRAARHRRRDRRGRFRH